MRLVVFFCFLLVCITASVLTKKLTVTAALTGGVLALLIFFGVGWAGIALLGAFFTLGTLATSWQKGVKQGLSIAQEKGRRNAGQVLANGGAAGLLGGLAIVLPQNASLHLFLIAAVFSSATADTISSELGSVYGRGFYDILTFKKGLRGADGVISIEGLLFGFAGSAIMALIHASAEGWSERVTWILIAGTVGNLTDSYLGATLERKSVIKNDAVNFLNTVMAIVVALLLWRF